LKAPAKQSAVTAKHPNQLRIIGGQWRGRKLRFADVEGLRPTGDRIRETLFNWLAPELSGARCLDVFAGSGALGLEALSRGASLSCMLERDALAAARLRDNLELLSANNGEVHQTESLQHLRLGNSDQPFAIVFIDPPFGLNLWQSCIDLLESGNWLAESASIYIESSIDTLYQVPANWALHRDKRAGSVSYRLYYREPADF
jgi:16S rRNA (guanine966-N2)-methyltransferase